MRAVVLSIAGVLALVAVVIAIRVMGPKDPPGWVTCNATAKFTDDQKIAACTTVINSGVKGDQLEAAWRQRGLANQDAGTDDKAVDDLTEALKLKPDDADALAGRGAAYMGNSDNDHALADLNH